jgi:hypothetical protein
MTMYMSQRRWSYQWRLSRMTSKSPIQTFSTFARKHVLCVLHTPPLKIRCMNSPKLVYCKTKVGRTLVDSILDATPVNLWSLQVRFAHAIMPNCARDVGLCVSQSRHCLFSRDRSRRRVTLQLCQCIGCWCYRARLTSTVGPVLPAA